MPHYQQLDPRWLPAVQPSYADPVLSRRRQRASLSFGVHCERGNFSQKTFFPPADFLLNVIDHTVSHVHLKNSHLEREWNYFDWFRPKSLTNHLPQVPPPSPITLGIRFSAFGFGKGHKPSDRSIPQAIREGYGHPNKIGFLLPRGEGQWSGEVAKAVCYIT